MPGRRFPLIPSHPFARGDARRSVLLALACALLIFAVPARAATQKVEVPFADKAEFLRLLEAVPETQADGLTVDGYLARFFADEARVPAIRALGFAVEVIVPDVESAYAARLAQGLPQGLRTGFGAYHTYDEAIADMDALQAAHPSIMSPKQSIGTTIEGRQLWVYKISDNPGVDEAEPEIFFNAYIHAREVITFEIVYDLAQYLVNGYGVDPRATAIVQSREVFIEPVVNPDGVQYNYSTDPNGGGMWRKNRRDLGGGNFGIDLNRNFGYQWGYDDEGSSPYTWSETYRGSAAWSEPEISAMRDFVVGRHFHTVINLHSYANIHCLPFGYELIHCDDYDEMVALSLLRSIDNNYSPGTGSELLYPTNGDAVDWFYGDTVLKPRIFGIVTEAGTDDDGFWPPESRLAPIVAENREGNLRTVELADNPYRALPPGVAAVTPPAGTIGPDFTLAWSVPAPDPDNPAVAWNLIEATGHTVGADNLEGTNANRWSSFGWTLTTARSHSATHSYFSGAANKTNRFLTSRRGHRVAPGEQLRFWTRYNIEEDWDYGYVEIATDARDFVSLPGSITTNDDYNDRNFGNGITGSSSGWVEAVFDISAYEGEVVWIRFRYNTDQAVTEEGWYVDDIRPADLFATETQVATSSSVAEHSFEDHATGAFSYLVQSVDAEGETAVWGVPLDLEVQPNSGVRDDEGPLAWRGLEIAGCNPMSGPVALRFSLPADARPGDRLSLTIHDVNGRAISTLRDEVLDRLPSSDQQAVWNPGQADSGLYFAKLEIGRHVSHRTFLRLQ
ncbi:MAG: immune inhibitor A [Candidatus Eisenbacteria bacterium]|nr:immune inhibitor A [Candidatus Eisenbacteria bacterium]